MSKYGVVIYVILTGLITAIALAAHRNYINLPEPRQETIHTQMIHIQGVPCAMVKQGEEVRGLDCDFSNRIPVHIENKNVPQQ